MARETRRQRRDQREELGRRDARGRGAPRAHAQQPAAGAPGHAAAPRPRRAGGEPRQRGRFVRESWAELQEGRVAEPSQVVQGTVVVIIACVIVGTYPLRCDQVFKPFVRNVLLGQ